MYVPQEIRRIGKYIFINVLHFHLLQRELSDDSEYPYQFLFQYLRKLYLTPEMLFIHFVHILSKFICRFFKAGIILYG